MPPSVHIFKITAKIKSELEAILRQFQSAVEQFGGNIISHSMSSIMDSLSFIAVVQIRDMRQVDKIKNAISIDADIQTIEALYDL